MNNKEWVMVIGVISVFWGICYMLCVDAFSTASMILYGDASTLPIQATTAIILTTIIPLITYKYWVKLAEWVIVSISHFLIQVKPIEYEDEDVNADDEWAKQCDRDYGKRE